MLRVAWISLISVSGAQKKSFTFPSPKPAKNAPKTVFHATTNLPAKHALARMWALQKKRLASAALTATFTNLSLSLAKSVLQTASSVTI